MVKREKKEKKEKKEEKKRQPIMRYQDAVNVWNTWVGNVDIYCNPTKGTLDNADVKDIQHGLSQADFIKRRHARGNKVVLPLPKGQRPQREAKQREVKQRPPPLPKQPPPPLPKRQPPPLPLSQMPKKAPVLRGKLIVKSNNVAPVLPDIPLIIPPIIRKQLKDAPIKKRPRPVIPIPEIPVHKTQIDDDMMWMLEIGQSIEDLRDEIKDLYE